MRLGLFFSIVFTINYLLVVFFGQNFLTAYAKNSNSKPYFHFILLVLSWFISAIISYVLLFFLFNKSYTESLAPLTFTILSLSIFNTLSHHHLAVKANKHRSYQMIVMLVNTMILSMIFLEPHLVSSLGRLSMFVGSTVGAILCAMTLNYHFSKHLEVAILSKSWDGHPIHLLITAMMSVALIVFSHF